MRKYSLLLASISFFTLANYPSYSVSEETLQALLKESAELFPTRKVRFKKALPEDHPIITQKNLTKPDKAALRLEEAKKEGVRPELEFLALRDAKRMYDKHLATIYRFEVTLMGAKYILDQGGKVDVEGRQDITTWGLSRGFDENYTRLEKLFGTAITESLRKVVGEWNAIQRLDFVKDRETISARLQSIEEAFKSLVQPFRNRGLETYNKLFDIYVSIPEFASQHKINWLTQTIVLGQDLLLRTQGDRHVQVLESLHKVHGELASLLEKNQDGNVMGALLDDWSFQTFNRKLSGGWRDKDYLPKPLPMVGLEYSWAQLYRARIEAFKDPTFVKDYFAHLLKAVNELAADEHHYDHDKLRTHGMSRFLAFEMLRDAHYALLNFERMGLCTAEQFGEWKTALTQKVCELGDFLGFSDYMSVKVCDSYYEQAFAMLSMFFESPLKKYIYQQLSHGAYQGPVCEDVATRHVGCEARSLGRGSLLSLDQMKKSISKQSAVPKEAAFAEAVRLVEDYRKQAGDTDKTLTKLIAFTQAGAMVGIAGNMGEAEELRAKVLAESDVCLDAYKQELTTEFEGRLPSLTDDPTTFVKKLKEARSSNRSFERIIGHIHNAHQKTLDQYVHWRLKWEIKANPKVDELSNFFRVQEQKLKDLVWRYVEQRCSHYRDLLAKGGDGDPLAAKLEKELIALSEFKNLYSLLERMELILELRFSGKRKALKSSKTAVDVIRLHREACDVLAVQRDKYPALLHTVEEIDQTRKHPAWAGASINWDRVYESSGWERDEKGWNPTIWKKGIISQRSHIDDAVVSYLQEFRVKLEDLSLVECQCVLADVTAVIDLSTHALDETNPYNVLTTDSWGYYGHQRPQHVIGELRKRFTPQMVEGYKDLLTFLETLERQDLSLNEFEQLMATPGGFRSRNIITYYQEGTLKKRLSDKLVSKLKDLSLEAFFEEVRCLSKDLREMAGSALTSLGEGKVRELLAEKQAALEASRTQIRIEQSLDKKRELLADHCRLVKDHDGLLARYIVSSGNSWGRLEKFIHVGHARFKIPGMRDLGSELSLLQREVEDYCVRLERDRKDAELKEKVEDARQKYEDLRVEANRVKEVATSDREKIELYKKVKKKVDEYHLTVLCYENEAFQEVQVGLATLAEKLEDLVTPHLVESRMRLNELRSEANKVKDVAKSDREKREQYSRLRKQANELHIAVVDYDSRAFQGIRKELKTLREKLDNAVKQYQGKK